MKKEPRKEKEPRRKKKKGKERRKRKRKNLCVLVLIEKAGILFNFRLTSCKIAFETTRANFVIYFEIMSEREGEKKGGGTEGKKERGKNLLPLGGVLHPHIIIIFSQIITLKDCKRQVLIHNKKQKVQIFSIKKIMRTLNTKERKKERKGKKKEEERRKKKKEEERRRKKKKEEERRRKKKKEEERRKKEEKKEERKGKKEKIPT